LDHGILAHFFRKELDPNEGNLGKVYLQKAIEKQKRFEKVFLRCLVEGERQK
jgi:hypothetical protein